MNVRQWPGVSIWDKGFGTLPGAEGSLGQRVPGSL